MLAAMHAVPQVVFDEDASPLARVFAKNLSRALLTGDGASLLRSINIPFALRSASGKQAITIDPTDDQIVVRNGVSSIARIVIALSFDDSAKRPRVEKGLLRHPLVLYRITRLLTLPGAAWEENAHEFWEHRDIIDDSPANLLVVNTSDGSQLTLGATEEPASKGQRAAVELHGSESALQSVFLGQSLLVSDVMQGKLRFRGSLAQLAALTGIGQAILLGEVDG